MIQLGAFLVQNFPYSIRYGTANYEGYGAREFLCWAADDSTQAHKICKELGGVIIDEDDPHTFKLL